MSVPVPTLTTSGWVDDVVSMSNHLMDHFIVAHHSQTHFYKGHVASLPYLVQRYSKDPHRLAQQTQDTLYRYLSRYFDQVRVTAEPTGLNNQTVRYNIDIDAVLSDGRQGHSLGRLIAVGESSILGVEEKGGPPLERR